MRLIAPPEKSEYPDYAEMYMKLVPRDGTVLQFLADNFQKVKEFICGLPTELLTYRYEPDKWTIREILVHIIDDERIYAYRALRFARGEKQSLPGFDQDEYAHFSKANERSLDSIFEEYEAVRLSTIALYNGLPEDCFLRIGTGSSSYHAATVRALAYHIAGHEQRHINIIKERYLGDISDTESI